MRFLHLRVSFLSLLSFCILMYFVSVAKHIFHLSLVFASISFQSFQQCVFYFGVAGCMNFFLSVLIFCFCIVFYSIYIPSSTKCLEWVPPGGKFEGSRMGTRYDCRTLTSPQCRTLEVLVPRVVFFDVVICCFRPLQISMDHVEVVTWKAWCPSFWALSKVPGTLVIGKCAILGVGFLRVCITLYGYCGIFIFPNMVRQKIKCRFYA